MDGTKWPEVRIINRYAVLIGSLEMGIKALGIFIVTWTTVVLLGGFVSVLDKKDFWCLTVIMLLQPAGLFNQNLGQAQSSLLHVWVDLVKTSFAIVMEKLRGRDALSFNVSIWSVMLSSSVSAIEALLLAIILCPFMILYLFGMYISAGVGLWRLTEHKFGNADGAENFKPALQFLYNLAVVQGVIYTYKAIHIIRVNHWFSNIVNRGNFSMNKDLVAKYINDTIAGCWKDPSFANNERNFLTYAVDLMMDEKSNDDFVTGVMILGAVIIDESPTGLSRFSQDGCPELQKCLLTRPSLSFSHLIPRLLEILDHRGRDPYNETIRAQAAGIVALLASSIHLEENPRWINCISSTLEAFCPVEGACSDIGADYVRLVGQGFNALRRLAVHQNNCQIIMNTEGLPAKITAPIRSDELHRDQHDMWATVAQNSYKLVMQLAVIPGETGIKLKNEISRSSKAIITTLESILECLKCEVALKTSAVEFALDLSVDISSIKASGRTGTMLNWVLLLIFHPPDDVVCSLDNPTENNSRTRRLAGEMLSSNLEQPLEQSVGIVLRDLTASLVGTGDISTRLHAGKILDYLCFQYKKDDEFLKELKNSMVSVMIEVLEEILALGDNCCDLEMGGVSGGQQSTGHEVEDITRLHRELTELCWTIRFKWYREDESFKEELDNIAEKVCADHGKIAKNFRDFIMRYKRG